MRLGKRILVYCTEETVMSRIKFLMQTTKPMLASNRFSAHYVTSSDALRAMLAVAGYDAILLVGCEGVLVESLCARHKILVIDSSCATRVWMEDLYFLTRVKRGPKKKAA